MQIDKANKLEQHALEFSTQMDALIQEYLPKMNIFLIVGCIEMCMHMVKSTMEKEYTERSKNIKSELEI